MKYMKNRKEVVVPIGTPGYAPIEFPVDSTNPIRFTAYLQGTNEIVKMEGKDFIDVNPTMNMQAKYVNIDSKALFTLYCNRI